MIIPEIATAYLTAFSASINSALRICGKIAGPPLSFVIMPPV
jgi:hypothetical protein